jgi:hypothetical protein
MKKIAKKSIIKKIAKLQNCKKSQNNHKILQNNAKYSASMFWTVIQPTVHGQNCHFAKMNNAAMITMYVKQCDCLKHYLCMAR